MPLTAQSLEHAAHVWLIPIRYDCSSIEPALAWLDGDEWECANNLRFDRDRLLYLESHVWLRRLLADATGEPPERLSFRRAQGRKPVLEQRPATNGGALRFSLSHTRGYAAIAMTRRSDIGVDIERVRPLEEMNSIGALVFHPDELARMRTLQPDDQVAAFFRLWTAKEAYVKALGEGLLHPFDSLCVTFTDNGHYRVTDETQTRTSPYPGRCVVLPGSVSPDGVYFVLSVLALDRRAPIVFHRIPACGRVTDPIVTARAYSN